MTKTELYNEGKEAIEAGALLFGTEKMRKASEMGSVKASQFLGFNFYLGRNGLPRDYGIATHYLEVFVSQASPNNPDNAEAHFFLGCIYAFKEAGIKDTKKALHHFQISAEHGNPLAEYYHNQITEKKSDRHLKWIVMPIVLGGIGVISWLLDGYDTLAPILSTAFCVAVILLYIAYEKRFMLQLPEDTKMKEEYPC